MHQVVDLNAIGNKKQTALLLAADSNHPSVVQLLLMEVAKQTVAEEGFTPLFCAASQGRLDIVKVLLQARGEKHLDEAGSATDQFLKLPPLLAAAGLGEESVVLYILNE